MSFFNNKLENSFERLVIVQSKKHFDHYLKNNKENYDVILSLYPSVLYGLKNSNLKIIFLKDILEDGLYKISSADSIKKINDLIDNLNFFSKSIDKKIEIGNYYAFQIWIIIGQIHYNYHICKAIKSILYNKSILLYTCSSQKLIYGYRPNPNSILADVFVKSNLFSSKDYKIITLKERKKLSFKKLLKSIVPEKLVSLVYDLKTNKFQIQTFLKKNKIKLLLNGAGYEWTKLSFHPSFNSEFTVKKIIPLKTNNKFQCPKTILNYLNNSINFSENIVYDLDFFGKFIYNDLVLYSKSYSKIKKKIDNYDALIGSVFTHPCENFFAHVAKMMRKPVVLYQHGEKGQSYDITSMYTELYYASDYFSYGKEVTKQYLELFKFRKISSVYTVGSLHKSVDWKNGENILYATGKWFKTASPFPQKIDPDYRLYNAQIKILNLFKKFKNEKFFFKRNNSKLFNEIIFDIKKYKNVEFNTKLSFTDLLIHSKVVILDTPATTLVEACSTKIPIFVLGGRVKYDKNFLKVVSKRVVWCNNIDILTSKVEDFLKHGKYDADVNNNEYYDNYCNSLNGEIETLNKVKKQIYNSLNLIKNE